MVRQAEMWRVSSLPRRLVLSLARGINQSTRKPIKGKPLGRNLHSQQRRCKSRHHSCPFLRQPTATITSIVHWRQARSCRDDRRQAFGTEKKKTVSLKQSEFNDALTLEYSITPRLLGSSCSKNVMRPSCNSLRVFPVNPDSSSLTIADSLSTGRLSSSSLSPRSPYLVDHIKTIPTTG